MKKFALLLSVVFKIFYKLRYGRHLSFGKRVIVDHRLRFRGQGKLIIGNDVNLWAHEEWNRFHTYDAEAVIQIGDRSRLNGIFVHCKKSVILGEDCLVGSCTLLDTDFHAIDFEKRNNHNAVVSKPILIGNKVWLAGQSVVLKGVTIGERAVVGFRAVVGKDVPAKAVVAGNPAQLVKVLN